MRKSCTVSDDRQLTQINTGLDKDAHARNGSDLLQLKIRMLGTLDDCTGHMARHFRQ